MRTTLVVVAALAAAGCKKDPPVTTGPGPISTVEQDALWKLAPAGAQVGVVVSGRGLAMIDGALAAIRQFAAGQPELASMVRDLDRRLAGITSFGDLGFVADRGVGLFAGRGGEDVAILPIADLEKFFARIGGRMECRPVAGYQACAKNAALLDKVGTGDLRGRLDAAGARGDIEIVGAVLPTGPQGAVVAQLSRGSVVLRGAIDGVPPQIAQLFQGHSRPRTDDTTAAFVSFDVRPMIASFGVPIMVREIGRTIAGPVTMTTSAGEIGVDIRVPLSDPGPLRMLLEKCEEIPDLRAKLVDGACRVPYPGLDIEFAARIEGSELRIARVDAPKGKRVPLGPVGSEIARGEWSAASFGHGTILASTIPFERAVPRGAERWISLAIRAFAALNEVGMAVRFDGGTARFILSVRTVWSNPDDVVQKVLAIPPHAIMTGKAPEAGRSIAAAAPGSPFAADFEAGTSGGLAMAAPVGILAAVAVPMFLDTVKKPKKSEAMVQLHRIAARAKEEYATTGKFPQKATALTPSAPCCAEDFGGKKKCAVLASNWDTPAWRDLDFSMDEPHFFQYRYTPTATGFVATAVGDLDCDTVMIEYRAEGTIVDGRPHVTFTEPPPNSD